MALLWRYGLFAGLLLALGVWHLADKSKAVDDALELLRGEYIAAALVASESARQKEIALNLSIESAKNAAAIREKTLLADAGRSRAAADRLRDDLAHNRAAIANATPGAVAAYADTLAVVFEQCTREYLALAGNADAHAIDSDTLFIAWKGIAAK